MNIIKNCSYCLILIIGVLLSYGWKEDDLDETETLNNFEQEFLDRHNYYRDQVNVPHLKWSKELAAYAQGWANKLAKKCEMYHSDTEYGENIYWTSASATPTEATDAWGKEEKYFNHRKRQFQYKSGHYSQVIWRNTTHVGGAMQKCKHGGEIWVCNYNPAGNIIKAKAY